MAYVKDEFAFTRGVGAIAAADARDKRKTKVIQLRRALATSQRDRKLAALGAISDGGLRPFGTPHTGRVGGYGPNQYTAGGDTTITGGNFNQVGRVGRYGGSNGGLHVPVDHTSQYLRNWHDPGYGVTGLPGASGTGPGRVGPGYGSPPGQVVTGGGGPITPPYTPGGIPVPGGGVDPGTPGTYPGGYQTGGSSGGGGGSYPTTPGDGGGADPGSAPAPSDPFAVVPGGKTTVVIAALVIGGYLLTRRKRGTP